jgi:serine/threonine protein kinase
MQLHVRFHLFLTSCGYAILQTCNFSIGRARLTDFGCARRAAGDDDDGSALLPIGGTPAFMAPEVARGEEQGPAADVWALGCTVVEMATGRAPWSDVCDDLLAAVHRIGYTAAVPEVPGWLSAEAKDFLDGCFRRRAGDRSTAAQLLDNPFVATAAAREYRAEPVKEEWASPRSTLHDNALWDSDTDEDEEEITTTPAERIGALACTASALPDWDSDEGWIHVHGDGEVFGVLPMPATSIGPKHQKQCEPFAVPESCGGWE